LATTNKNFKVKNGLDVNGPIGVGTDPDYGIEGQILVSAGSNATPTWSDNSAESTFYLVRNNTGSTIAKGTLVSAYGAEPSGRIDVTPHETTGLQDSELRVMGVATANISNGVNGTVMSFGTLKDIDTRGNVASAIAVGDETWAEGDILYAHPTVAGKLTNVRPQHDLAVAFITVRHASSGQIAVRIIPGNHHLEWLHDVAINSPANNQVLTYSSGVWINANAAGGSGNSFETISANGTSVVADSSTDTLTLTPSNGVLITGNATSDTITISTNASDANGASTIVARDANGSFTANIITAALSGTATFAGTANSVALANVTGLATALDEKANLSGATFTGDIAVNGGDITTNQTTATLYNTTATTVHIGNAANVTLGNITHSGNVTVNNDLVVYGSITFNNGASELSSTTIQVDDTLISLSDNNAADTSDVGFYAGYKVSTVDYHTGLVRDASDKVWNLFSNVAQPTGTVDFTNAVYDTLKLGNVISTSLNSNATVQLLPGYTSTAAVIQLGDKSNVASTPGIIFNSGTTGSNVYDASISASGGNASTGNGNLSIHANVITIGNASSNTSTVNVAGNLIVYSDVRAANIRNPFGAQLNVISTAYPMLIEAVDGITLSGNVTYKTHTAGTNNNLLASTSYVDNAIISPFLLMGG
jgi:hypothetical protein